MAISPHITAWKLWTKLSPHCTKSTDLMTGWPNFRGGFCISDWPEHGSSHNSNRGGHISKVLIRRSSLPFPRHSYLLLTGRTHKTLPHFPSITRLLLLAHWLAGNKDHLLLRLISMTMFPTFSFMELNSPSTQEVHRGDVIEWYGITMLLTYLQHVPMNPIQHAICKEQTPPPPKKVSQFNLSVSKLMGAVCADAVCALKDNGNSYCQWLKECSPEGAGPLVPF